jgi:hypothetical protein
VTRRVLAGLALAAAGCPSGGADADPTDTGVDGSVDSAVPDTDTPPVAGMLEVGTGGTMGEIDCDAFVPVAEGDPLAMVHGPQGGWHLDVSIRGTGLPERVVFDVRLVDVQTGTVVSFLDPIRTRVRLVPDPAGEAWTGRGCYLGVQGILDFTSMGADPGDPDRYQVLVDRTVRVEATLSTDDGTWSDAVEVLVRPDPCDADLTQPGCLCDPAAAFQPPFCADDTDADTDG